MTIGKKIQSAALGILLGSFLVAGMAMVGYSVARSDSGSAVVMSTGSGSVISPPSSQLRDPLQDPRGAIGDLELAKKKGGWLGLILVGLYVSCRLLGKLSTRFPPLAFLSVGRTAAIIAGAGTLLSGCVDAFMLGGTYVTVGIAALYGVVGLLGTGEKKTT